MRSLLIYQTKVSLLRQKPLKISDVNEFHREIRTSPPSLALGGWIERILP
ncbi:hypothetical protein [Jodiemicrovirus-1]|nr:hypothetical protein [Jodiemicrovirus-1]